MDVDDLFADLADDLSGAGDPLERPGILVVGADVIFDGADEFGDTPKRAAPNALAGNFSKPALDLIQPR